MAAILNHSEFSPKVAVIIPSYNRWPLVCEAVDSVLSQTYENTECLVADDASGDGSPEKLRSRYGEKITILSNETNREKSFCRNRGVKETGAQYVCFLDSDDLLTPNSVSDRISVFLDNPGFSGLVAGVTQRPKQTAREAVRKFKSELDFSKDLLRQYIGNCGALHTSGFMLSRQDMLKHGMFTEQLVDLEDIELLVRLLCKLPCAACRQVVSIKRPTGGSSHSNYPKIIEQGFAFSEALKKDPVVVRKLGDKIRLLEKMEYKHLLGALYHANEFGAYLELYRKKRAYGLSPRETKFFRRYLICALREKLHST